MPFSFNPLLGVGLDKSIPLDGAGKIPSTFLPSYVDDVEEYNNLAAFPATGETGKIYVAIDTGFVYRWSGSIYVQIGVTAAAGSTTQVQFNDGGAFGGDAGLVFDKTTDALTIAGPVVHPLGAAATPSLTFTGDPNTGIYSPGADQLAISTNGTGRLFVDASGNIGASDSSPSSNTIGTGVPTVVLRGTSGAQPTRSGGLCFISQNGTSKTLAYHDSGIFYLQSTAATAQAFLTSNVERMRLTSAGLLGLGTSSPRSQLNVSSNGATILTLENSGTALLENSVFGQIDFYANDASTNGTGAKCNIKAFTENATGNIAALTFSTSSSNSATGVERLRITGAGNVGIGTTSPSSLLHLADAGDITVGTTTGTKIGTATTQKIGFYNATPVVQPAAVADATDAATVITQLNDLLAKLRTLGIIAT